MKEYRNEFVRKNYKTMTISRMAEILKINHQPISIFMKKEGLVSLHEEKLLRHKNSPKQVKKRNDKKPGIFYESDYPDGIIYPPKKWKYRKSE